ncbi:transposase [Massilia sp. Dwa41.01b]|uniref:transposase n=1 Tax=unclassified Massilia TaxID=2609279 RepID=UPI001603C84C|nr:MULTISPECIES: transposase [unclassified Massilia]QNA87371.1 transposase [Massilia sp. Dwa41.01b]QNA98278.1 transposase [Massilia sp. Se16.2.3]
MARQPRLILPKQPHHIVQRGNNSQAVFREPEDYERFLGWLKEAAKFYRVAIHAYALLPNHVHLLATPDDEAGLAAMMQKLGRFYVPWFNNKYARTGGLFEGRFRTAVVDTDRHFLMCSRFIELAPVREGEVADPAFHAWSSYAHHAGLRPSEVVTDHALFWRLGNTPFQREAAYIDLVGQGIAADELEQIAGAVRKGQPLGSHAFKLELERKSGRRILPAKRGRPFKVQPPLSL